MQLQPAFQSGYTNYVILFRFRVWLGGRTTSTIDLRFCGIGLLYLVRAISRLVTRRSLRMQPMSFVYVSTETAFGLDAAPFSRQQIGVSHWPSVLENM